MYYYILGAVIFGLLIWITLSYAVIWTVKEPTYSVIENKNGYEVREYAPYIMAVTSVSGTYDEATNQGFRIIADYIFGNNTKKESIAMTTPVLEQKEVAASEKIAMTTPVLTTDIGTDGTRTIAFVLPSTYTLDTLPQPNNKHVKLIPVPARKVAVLRYSWYPTEARTNAKKEQLKSYLVRDSQKITGPIETARYNPPLSMPLTLRNEIFIPIE